MPSASSSLDLTETETTEIKVTKTSSEDCGQQAACEPECPAKEKKCYDPSTIALWIIALVLIIIWICALWSLCSSGFGGDSDCDSDCDKDSGWGCSGYVIGVIVWIILVIIFVAAIYYAGWWALMFFLILTIIFGGIACWCRCSKKSGRRDSC